MFTIGELLGRFHSPSLQGIESDFYCKICRLELFRLPCGIDVTAPLFPSNVDNQVDASFDILFGDTQLQASRLRNARLPSQRTASPALPV